MDECCAAVPPGEHTTAADGRAGALHAAAASDSGGCPLKRRAPPLPTPPTPPTPPTLPRLFPTAAEVSAVRAAQLREMGELLR